MVPLNLLEIHQNHIQTVCFHVHKRFEEYEIQYQILIKELGILCHNKSKDSEETVFFNNLKDFIQMAMDIYPKKSAEYKAFVSVDSLIQDFMKGKIKDFEQADDSTKALLLQLSLSAWTLTKSSKTIYDAAHHLEKKTRNKTRKHRS